MSNDTHTGDVAAKLRRQPHKTWLKSRSIGKKDPHVYLAISTIERVLDELFGWDGWETYDEKSMIVGNEVVGSLTLAVYSERRGQWIRRTGSAAALITQRAQLMFDHEGKPVMEGGRHKTEPAKPSDIDAKIPNAMELSYPHLFSDCLTNAAKKLGKILGRDLGRKAEDIEKITDAMNGRDYQDFCAALWETKGLPEADDLFRSLPEDQQSHHHFVDAFNKYRHELREKALQLAESNGNGTANGKESSLFG